MVWIVEETYLTGHSVSLAARRHGIAGNQLFTSRRLNAQGVLTAAGAGQEVVPASHYRALEGQVRELQRLLRKKTMENEVLREAETWAAGPKKIAIALEFVAGGRPESAAAAAKRRVAPTPAAGEDGRRSPAVSWSR